MLVQKYCHKKHISLKKFTNQLFSKKSQLYKQKAKSFSFADNDVFVKKIYLFLNMAGLSIFDTFCDVIPFHRFDTKLECLHCDIEISPTPIKYQERDRERGMGHV
jgi:hypothetical protein